MLLLLKLLAMMIYTKHYKMKFLMKIQKRDLLIYLMVESIKGIILRRELI